MSDRTTPGPWDAKPSSIGGPMIISYLGDGRSIFVGTAYTKQVWNGHPLDQELAEPEAIANCKLMAAAPDLRDACLKFEEAMNDGAKYKNLGEALVVAKAALRKAGVE